MTLPPARQLAADAGTWVLSLLVLGVLVMLGTSSTLFAIAAVGLAVILVMVLCFDLVVAGTAFVTLAMFLAPLNDLRLSPTSYVTASDVTFVLGFGILLPTVLRSRVQFPPPFVFGLIVLVTMGTIATVASGMAVVSANQLGRLVVGAFALPIFLMVWRPSQAVVTRLAAAYVLGATFDVFMALAQGPGGDGGRYVGLTYHPNYFALGCLLGASLVPWVVLNVGPQLRWAFWFCALICSYGVFISGSRAALLVLIMLVCIYPFVEGSARAVWFVLAGFTGVLAFSGKLLTSDNGNALGRLLGNGSAADSDIQRNEALDDALAKFRDHPFLGNGFDGGLGAHNIYLQVAVAVGVFGLIGYLFIMWTGLRSLFWPGPNHRLAYPFLAYAAIGPLTNTLWERMIWCVMALTLTINLRPPQLDDDADGAGTEQAPDLSPAPDREGSLAQNRNP